MVDKRYGCGVPEFIARSSASPTRVAGTRKGQGRRCRGTVQKARSPKLSMPNAMTPRSTELKRVARKGDAPRGHRRFRGLPHDGAPALNHRTCADPAARRIPTTSTIEYVLPTASQLASWRAVFQSLLAGAWDSAHLQARMISSTYNVVQFLDTPTGRTYYVLMEGVPGQIPAPASHPSGSVTITGSR